MFLLFIEMKVIFDTDLKMWGGGPSPFFPMGKKWGWTSPKCHYHLKPSSDKIASNTACDTKGK